MAEVSAGTDTSQQKKKNILEEKSHEDLVKLVKKQLTLLQKAKSKSDELGEKCLKLEQEKNSMIEDYQKNESKLTDEIKCLKSYNLELLEEKKQYGHDKELEISRLNKELEESLSEKNKYFISSRDSQEKNQCLSMQLDTLKATCQCLQAELQKIQSSNKDTCEENAVLINARDSALQSLKDAKVQLDKKSEMYDKCVNEFQELEKKYGICIHENCVLTSNIECLERKVEGIEKEKIKLSKSLEELETDQNSKQSEKKLSDDNDFSILVIDNQVLREQVDSLKKEIEVHKQNISEDTQSCANQKKYSEMEKENCDLQKALIDAESSINKLRNVKEELEERNKSILLDLECSRTKESEAQSLVSANAEEILKLESELKRLATVLEQNSLGGYFEHALLYGAPADSLTNINENSKGTGTLHAKETSTTVVENSLKSNKVIDVNEFGILEASPGFELALLEGGNAEQLFPSEFDVNENSLSSGASKKESNFGLELEDNFCITKEEIKDLMYRNEELQKEYDVIKREFNFMATKLDTCSSLLQETLELNEELNLKLSSEMKHDIIESPYSTETIKEDEVENKTPNMENVSFVHKLVQTDDAPKIFSLDEIKVSGHVEHKTLTVKNTKMLMNQDQVDELSETIVELEKCNENLKAQSEVIEKHNTELSEKLEKKCAEVNDFNLQLELLVIAIKQGVRQKTSTTYKAENDLAENMNTLKLLLNDLVSRSNNYTLKLKTMQSDLEDIIIQKSNLEEELVQVKELNQFLEDEAMELRDEVDHLKSNLKEIENFESFNKTYEAPSELYSIEETNELEDKVIASNVPQDNIVSKVNADSTMDVNYLSHKSRKLCETSTEMCCTLNDQEIQTGSYDDETNDQEVQTDSYDDETNDQEVQTDSYDDEKNDKGIQTDSYKDETNNIQTENDVNAANDKLIPEKLLEENTTLKDTLCDKTKLVERIHCEMDSLLTKIEELTSELQEKEDDLNICSSKKTCLEETLKELSHVEKQRMLVLKSLSEVLLELKTANCELALEFKGLFSFFKEIINEFSKGVGDAFNYVSSKKDCLEIECSHAKTNYNAIKDFAFCMTRDIELWISFLNPTLSDYLNGATNCKEEEELEGLLVTCQRSNSSFILAEQKCMEHLCCNISNDIQSIDTAKRKLLFELHKYFSYFTVPLIKELRDYKVNIVPSLEKTIKNLENKLLACSDISKNTDPKGEQNINENMSTESLKLKLQEAETKMNKFKQIALKLKKETALLKNQCEEMETDKQKTLKDVGNLQQELSKLSLENYQCLQNYQSLQNEHDKLQDEFDVKVAHNKKIEDDFANLLLEYNSGKEQINELDLELKRLKQMLETNALFKHEFEAKHAELESKVIILDNANQEKVKRIQDLEEETQKKMNEFKITTEENKALKEKLEFAQKEGKKKSLLDLEMADYERSILELNNEIQKKDNEIIELQNDIKCLIEKNSTLHEEMKSTEMLKRTEEDRALNLKEVLEKTKVQLMSVREHESELLGQNSSLQIQLELMTQKDENYKLHLSEMSAEVQSLKEAIKVSAENHQRIVKSHESKISTQKQEILIAHKEVESVKQEFESYKIRVHSVLKQQKNTTPGITSIEADLKEKLETMNEKFKLQIKDLSEKLTALTLEYETLQEEHENLFQRYNKILEEREKKDLEWQQRLDQVALEKNRIAAAQEELSSQHLLQNEMLVATYKKQIKIMSEEHKRTINDLQKQLDNADVEISRLQREQQKLYGTPSIPSVPDNTVPFDIFSQERQEGEGSESTDEITTPVRQLSLATIPTSGFLPFDKLLQLPTEPGTPASVASTHDAEKLITDLNAANKKIDHLSELLNDSESANLRFGEQIRVLKEELRRLERNKEREQHAENLEYLKNVFIQFSTSPPCSEKAMLIPVLTTMLKLSPNEQQQLKDIAGDIDQAESANSGWGSYLHRWSGLS